MLTKLFTKENVFVNGYMTGIFFLVWITFLGYSLGEAFFSALFFFAIMFFFDWLVLMFKGTE